MNVLVGIEFAGNCGFTLAHHLDTRGYPVVGVLPFLTKRWKDVMHGAPLKTDEKDAGTIADLVSHGRFVGFPFLHPAHFELRQLTSAGERLSLEQTATVNRIRAVLHVAFPEYEKHFGSLTGKQTALKLLEAFPGPQALLAPPREEVLELVRTVSRGQFTEAKLDKLLTAARESISLSEAQTAPSTELPMLARRIRMLGEERDVIVEAMEKVMERLPEVPYLKTIPSIGAYAAGVYLGSIGDARAYQSVEQVLKVAGLNLVESSSGIRLGRKRISKRGRAPMRKQLYLHATRLITKEGTYRAQYDALRARGYHHNAAMVAVMRTLLRAIYAVARGQVPFDSEKSGAAARKDSLAVQEVME